MGKKHKKHHKHERNDVEEERDEKPLKLVLKVGTPDPRDNDSYDADTQEPRKHKHKKKKKHKDKKYDQEQSDRKQRKREHAAAAAAAEISDEDEEVTPKKPFVKSEDDVQRVMIDRTERNAAFTKTIDFLHKMLQRKDMNGFFAFPVTDAIAPLYSTIIKQPMDFTTMRQKIEEGEYSNLVQFRADFKLMCDNAMTYNHPDTIYYKEAQKLQATGLKQMSKERMLQLKNTLAFMTDCLDEDINQLGEEVLQSATVGDIPASSITTDTMDVARKPKKPKPSKFEAIPDRMSPEAILAQARAAAKEAADTLTLRKPASQYGFMRRQADGSTTMTILNSDNDGRVSNKEKIVNLGQLIGRIQAGSGILTGLREDKRNKANPVSYLNYGPFASYAPVYDSTTANISKEESDLLLAAYGDETGVEYCKSLRMFVGDSGDYALKMVDPWLDILTQGEHSRTMQQIAEREKREAAEKEAKEAAAAEAQKQKVSEEELKNNIDFGALRTLADIGIDVSFIDHFEKEMASKAEKEEEESVTDIIQKKLNETGEMLSDLQKVQHQRLSQKLPPHLAMLPGPSEKETKLAEKVTKELAELAKQVNPKAVVPEKGVREALGVSQKPSADGPQQSENEDEATPQADQSQPSSQTDQSQPSSQIDQSQPSSQTDQSQTSSQIDQSQPSSQTDQSQPLPQTDQSGYRAEVKEEEEMEGGTLEEGKESSVSKDSMDQDLDAVLDELEMDGGDRSGEENESVMEVSESAADL